MKTKVEMAGYEIEIELHEDSISIKAEKDDEVVEELTLPLSEESEVDDELPLEDEESMEDEMEDEESIEDEMEDFEDAEEGQLESFQSYINRSKRKKKVVRRKTLNESIDPQTIEMLAVALGPLVVGGTAVAIDKVMSKLKSGGLGKVGKELASKLEDLGKSAGDSRRTYQSKGKA
jgi:phosphate starvation-inducible protein PhoH